MGIMVLDYGISINTIFLIENFYWASSAEVIDVL